MSVEIDIRDRDSNVQLAHEKVSITGAMQIGKWLVRREIWSSLKEFAPGDTMTLSIDGAFWRREISNPHSSLAELVRTINRHCVRTPSEKAVETIERLCGPFHTDTRKSVIIRTPQEYGMRRVARLARDQRARWIARLQEERINIFPASSDLDDFEFPNEYFGQAIELLDEVLMATEEPKDEWRHVVIIHPGSGLRRVFTLTSDQAEVVRDSPFKQSSVQKGNVLSITATSDGDYHEMVRWIEDYRGRKQV